MHAPVVIAGKLDPSSETLHDGVVRLSEKLNIVLDTRVGSSEDRGRSAWIHGTAILGRRVLTNGEDLLTEVGPLRSLDDIAVTWGQAAKNPCVAFVVDRDTAQIRILPDPLGGGIVFRWASEQATYFSANVRDLISVAKLNGDRPRKSLEYLVERSLMGNGGLVEGSYEGLVALPVGTYVNVSLEGHAERAYPSFADDLDLNESYSEVLDRAREDITDSLKAIGNFSTEHRIAHLTGGFDSRLVLAALLASGQSGGYKFFTSGPTGTADRDIADALAGHYRLLRTEDGVLSPASLPQLRDQYLATQNFTAGMITGGPTGFEEERSATVLSGGYGELLRTFYSSATRRMISENSVLTGPELLSEMFGPGVLAENGLATPEAIERLAIRVEDSYAHLLDLGITCDNAGDAHYINYRNRYYVGQLSTHWAQFGSRFDPLYSRHASKLARMLPFAQREANIAGFDLMQSWAPGLAALPFDKPRLVGEFPRYRRLPKTRPFSGEPPRFVTATRDRPTVPNSPVDSSKRRQQITESRRLGVPMWQIASMEAAQSELRSILDNCDLREFSNTLNRSYVTRLSKDTLTSRREIRHLYSVYSMMLWYTDGD